ncbi:MAG TPA: cupin, partial [Acidimicrobiia bacterium]|nr:cupin [Acidimicrobiia bacterium]
MSEERVLGGIGTKVIFEDDRVRVWVLKLAPGERSAVHRHDLDHLLIQVRGDRIAVDPEPDT